MPRYKAWGKKPPLIWKGTFPLMFTAAVLNNSQDTEAIYGIILGHYREQNSLQEHG